MTQAYLNGCEWLCEDCGKAAGLVDSYCNGGGEADSPQHCASCGAFLENPLTGDGYAYVAEQLDNSHGGDREVMTLWAEFYKNEDDDLDRAIEESGLIPGFKQWRREA